MYTTRPLLLIAALFGFSATAPSQNLREREEDFLTAPPLVGAPLPSVVVYSTDGKPFDTSTLRGHYTVLTFGCLTCPPSMWNISGLEAVQRDYGPKGVQFYFIYKSLAHPELAGNYVQPFTIEERLAQANQAITQFGTNIPWIVDAMDNRLKRALGDRPNSQFLIDPAGNIARKRAWSNPAQVRKDLEEVVGSVEKITQENDLRLELRLPLETAAPRGVVVTRIPRLQMQAIEAIPQLDAARQPFYAKLRAEGDADLLGKGRGRLYLGFHLDPFHHAYWNNLAEPLSFQIEASERIEIDQRTAKADKLSVASDSDPREFLLNVKSWPVDEPLRIVVTYFACLGGESCTAVKQEYVLSRKRDIDGGGARGAGAGYWEAEEFTQRILMGDKDRDGKLLKSEAVGLILPHFEKLDKDKNGWLDRTELRVVSEWLNHRHQPGTPE